MRRLACRDDILGVCGRNGIVPGCFQWLLLIRPGISLGGAPLPHNRGQNRTLFVYVQLYTRHFQVDV